MQKITCYYNNLLKISDVDKFIDEISSKWGRHITRTLKETIDDYPKEQKLYNTLLKKVANKRELSGSNEVMSNASLNKNTFSDWKEASAGYGFYGNFVRHIGSVGVKGREDNIDENVGLIENASEDPSKITDVEINFAKDLYTVFTQYIEDQRICINPTTGEKLEHPITTEELSKIFPIMHDAIKWCEAVSNGTITEAIEINQYILPLLLTVFFDIKNKEKASKFNSKDSMGTCATGDVIHLLPDDNAYKNRAKYEQLGLKDGQRIVVGKIDPSDSMYAGGVKIPLDIQYRKFFKEQHNQISGNFVADSAISTNCASTSIPSPILDYESMSSPNLVILEALNKKKVKNIDFRTEKFELKLLPQLTQAIKNETISHVVIKNMCDYGIINKKALVDFNNALCEKPTTSVSIELNQDNLAQLSDRDNNIELYKLNNFWKNISEQSNTGTLKKCDIDSLNELLEKRHVTDLTKEILSAHQSQTKTIILLDTFSKTCPSYAPQMLWRNVFIKREKFILSKKQNKEKKLI